ncbi:AAR2 protein-domain-containing protein [Cladorrhinum sp. PSN259]|nr:AAR2 protein-domain-containing protein [Cladorrhinum sp. PSN259]
MEALDGPGRGPSQTANTNDTSPGDYFTNGNESLARNGSLKSKGLLELTEGSEADLLLSPTFSDAVASPSRNICDSPSLSSTLKKSNSGRLSIKSHKSVRVTGSFPLGRLRVHRVDSTDSVAAATPDQFDSGPGPQDDHHNMNPLGDCVSNGDVFRIIDLPDDFIVGLDSMAVTSRKSLTGFRDIPHGAHFLWVQQPGQISRSGYWFVTNGLQGEIRMKQWDKYNEVLGPVVSRVEDQAERQNMESLYLEMKPYSLSDTRLKWAKDSPAELWKTMTDAISTGFLARVTSKRHVAEFHVDTMDCVRGEIRPAMTTKDLTGVSCELDFITSQVFQDLRTFYGTEYSTDDTSKPVLALLENDVDVAEEDLVAELQFTFVSGTYLSNDTCLEQWWNTVLKIVLRATGLVASRPKLAKWFLQTLRTQLMFTELYVAPQGGEEEEENGTMMGRGKKRGPKGDRLPYTYKTQMKAKLSKGLVGFKRGFEKELRVLKGTGAISVEHEEVGGAWAELVEWLKDVGWDLETMGGEDEDEEKNSGENGERGQNGDSEDEDDQPVIVDLDEYGKEVGLVSFHD